MLVVGVTSGVGSGLTSGFGSGVGVGAGVSVCVPGLATTNPSPTKIASPDRLFHERNCATVMPFAFAICHNVSP